MGKNEDWFSPQGIQNHKQGMYEKEKKHVKIIITVFFAFSAVLYFICGVLSVERAINAGKINVDFANSPDLVTLVTNKVNPKTGIKAQGKLVKINNAYDACAIPEPIWDDSYYDEYKGLIEDLEDFCKGESACFSTNTNWTFIWAFNSSWMFLQAAVFVFMSFGGFWWYPRFFGTVLNLCCACCCHISSISMLFSGTMNPPGKICAHNLASSTYNGDGPANEYYGTDPANWKESPTYQDDASKMLGLAVTQLIFWCVQCCCCCIPLFQTPVKDKEHEHEKKAKKAAKEARENQNQISMMQMQMVQVPQNSQFTHGDVAVGVPTDQTDNSHIFYGSQQQPMQQQNLQPQYPQIPAQPNINFQMPPQQTQQQMQKPVEGQFAYTQQI